MSTQHETLQSIIIEEAKEFFLSIKYTLKNLDNKIRKLLQKVFRPIVAWFMDVYLITLLFRGVV
jgi:hypothetical protein